MRKLPLVALTVAAAVAIACGVGDSDETKQGPGFTEESSAQAPAGGTRTPAKKTTAAGQPRDDGKQTVVFEVTGKKVTKATSISYGIGGNTSQANSAKLPWKKRATSTDAFLLASLVAQSGSGGNGSITCRITVDGKVLVENTSQGPYAVVTCTEAG